jgi:hypothetical protein
MEIEENCTRVEIVVAGMDEYNWRWGIPDMGIPGISTRPLIPATTIRVD